MPNLSLLAPKDECELRRMLYSALGHEEGPVAVRYPRDVGVGRTAHDFCRMKKPQSKRSGSALTMAISRSC